MDFKLILLLVIIGLVAGFLSGILGVGGGVVIVPMMILLLSFTQQQAQGTSLAVLAVPVTFVAAYNYYQEGFVNWKYAAVIAAFFIIGGFFGSKIAVSLDQKLLKRIFGVVLLILALRMLFFEKGN
ncbi:MAG: sulfite exporter TauE/SafE family protein [Leeuwenhoekiella sp.]